MVGLSIVLEGQKGSNNYKNGTSSSHVKTQKVINKITMTNALATISSSSSSSSSLTSFRSSYDKSTSSFLERCLLCKRKLSPDEDIYMYKGDKAFCSKECRCRQIFMEEEEALTATIKRDKSCSLAAMRPRHTLSSSPCSRNRKVTRNAANGFTAY